MKRFLFGKKFLTITILVGALMALLASTALAAGPVAGQAVGFGPGVGIHAPGTGLTGTPGTGLNAGVNSRRGAPEWAGDATTEATLLGLTVEQLQAERLAGKSLAEIAAAKGISAETLVSKILEAKQAEFTQLVADGKLTQAQADAIYSNAQAQVPVMIERMTVGRPTSQPGVNPQGLGAGARAGGRWNR